MGSTTFAPRPPSNSRRDALTALLILVLAVAPHLGTLRNAFVGDDIAVLQEDSRLVAAGAVNRFFTEPYWVGVRGDPLYRPVVQATYVLNHRLSGFRPAPYHAVNLALHALVCLLLWRLALRAGASPQAALWTAALFAVHPVHVEPISLVVGRAELLAAAGVLGALLLHPGRNDPFPRAFLAAMVFLLALGAKENGAVFLGLVLVLDLARGGREGNPARALRSALPAYAVYAIAAALYLVARSHALAGAAGPLDYETQNPIHDVSTDVRVMTATSVLGRAFRMLLLPVVLSGDYGPHCTKLVLSALDPRFLFGVAVVVGFIVLLVRAFGRPGGVFFGGAAALLAYAPVSNIAIPIGTIFAERLLYLPSAGMAILAGCGIGAFLDGEAVRASRSRRIAAGALLLASLGCLLVRSVDRVRDWRDNLTLFRATIRACPTSAFAHAGLGYVSLQRGDLPTAIRAYTIARELMPSDARNSYMLGLAHMRAGHAGPALAFFGDALSKNPAHLDAAAAAAVLLRARGDEAAAARVQDRALQEFARRRGAPPPGGE